MVNGDQDTSAGELRCPRCGEPFRCGAAAGEAECWCFEAPAVTPEPAAESCLCQRCLSAAADAAAGGGEPLKSGGGGRAGRGRSPGSR